MYRCYNTTTVVEELYQGKDCTGELVSAVIAYNASLYTFDCYNDNLCDYTMVREYVDSSCDNTGSYFDIPIVIGHCSLIVTDGASMQYKCTETAVEEYIYDSPGCSGDYTSREIIYQNGDCGDTLNNYYEMSKCGDYSIDDESKGFRLSLGTNIFNACLFIMIYLRF